MRTLERGIPPGQDLSEEDATAFRALAARANYLAADRADLMFSTKELCREFSRPSRGSFIKLRRVVNYLVGASRLVWTYAWCTDDCNKLHAYSDTDFAGCRRTRRSTSGGAIMRGNHCVKTYSSTQSTIALSSAEAELI